VLDVVAHAESGESAGPGDELDRNGKSASVEVTVRAAPWLDVTQITLVADGKVVTEIPVPGRPSVTGPELGTLAEAQERTIRHHVSIPLPPGARWIMVLARGSRRADDVLAFMPFVPFGFTNPIWLR
jgi:hypothetical protein